VEFRPKGEENTPALQRSQVVQAAYDQHKHKLKHRLLESLTSIVDYSDIFGQALALTLALAPSPSPSPNP